MCVCLHARVRACGETLLLRIDVLSECYCLMVGCLAISVVACVSVCWSIPEFDGGVLDELGVAPVGVAAAATSDSTVAADVGTAFSSSRIVAQISFLISSLSAIDVIVVVVIELVPGTVVAGPADNVGVDMRTGSDR